MFCLQVVSKTAENYTEMNETDIRALSYRDSQKQCKTLGISAKGKAAELHDRLIEHFNSTHPSEVNEIGGTPVHHPQAENLPPASQVRYTPPGSEKRRLRALKAIELAARTPLPEQFEVMASPAPKQVGNSKSATVVKRSRGGCGLVLMFLLSSAFTAAVCMYTYRIDWDPVLKAGKSDVQAGLKEYTRQAQALGETDYADFLSTKEKVTIKAKAFYDEHVLPLPDRMQALYVEYSKKAQDYINELSGTGAGASTRAMDFSCQAPINGFEIKFFAPSRTFSSVNGEHGQSLMKLLTDLSNVHQRFKSVTHLVEYVDTQETEPTVAQAMKELGCDGGSLAGQCMIVDFEVLNKSENQGAALQALVAPQLKKSPSSMFFIQNIEWINASGAAVFLALIGEHGVLNQPGCDLSTQASAALIFVPVDPTEMTSTQETLEDFEATIANNLAVLATGRLPEVEYDEPIQIDDAVMKEAETTAAALRRRISESVLRAKPLGEESVIGSDEQLSDKANAARAVEKPSAEEVAEAQKRRVEAQKAGAVDSKEL